MTSLITKRRTIKDNLIIFFFKHIFKFIRNDPFIVEQASLHLSKKTIDRISNRRKNFLSLCYIDRRGSIDLILRRILRGRGIEEEGRPRQEIPIRGWRQSRERNEAILIMGSYMEEEGKRSLRNSIGIWTRHRCRITERSVDIQRVCSCTRELIRLSGFLL